MDFKKYNSIENSYRRKYIDTFEKYLGSDVFHNVEFVVKEKLDGANIQLVFIPNQEMKVGKRSCFLSREDNFFDIWNTLERYKTQLDKFQTLVDNVGVTLRVFGELYGPGINGRIDYGPEKKIAIFDIYTKGMEFTYPDYASNTYLWTTSDDPESERLMTQIELEALMFNSGCEELLCPLVGFFPSLHEALSVDVETLQKAGMNGSEGVIIQPYSKVIRMPNGERFILKKKSSKFEDKSEKSDEHKAQPKEKDIIYDLNKLFNQYITKNRVIDVFAKYGEIQDPTQIREYIDYILNDAKEDFKKDHDLNILVPNMDKKQERNLFNVGGRIVSLLKEFL
jgi:Rnl2 family RNA ligase